MTKDITPIEIENMDERTRDEYFMAFAMEEARKAYGLGEIPIGAILVKDNTIVSRHHNRRELDHDATAHAELIAIRRACKSLGRWRLTEMTLYVTIEPCPMCAGACGWAQLGRIVYGTRDEKRGYERYAPDVLHAKATVTAGVLEEECRELMKSFFSGLRK